MAEVCDCECGPIEFFGRELPRLGAVAEPFDRSRDFEQRQGTRVMNHWHHQSGIDLNGHTQMDV